MEDDIAADPFAAPIIQGTGGIRKKRWALPGKGKSGGIRTICCCHGDDDTVYLLTAYPKSSQEDLSPQDRKACGKIREGDQAGNPTGMTMTRTTIGRDVEEALGEVLAHVTGAVALPSRIVDAPTAERVRAIRRRTGKSRAQFEEAYGIDARALQDWEQGRRTPDRNARILLAVIEKDPGAVERAVAEGIG